jgi:dTDP-4-amino-4,6-dideoxygalactose transaminase
MIDRGIETTHYPVLHELETYASYARMGSLPNAEAVAARHLALPLSSYTTSEQVDVVVAALRAGL